MTQPTVINCADCNQLTSSTNPLCWPCRQRRLQRAADWRRRNTPRALSGVDIDAVVAELLAIPVFRELIGRRKVQVVVGHHSTGTCGGRAWPLKRKIRINGGPAATPAQVLEVVMHELCHLAAPRHGHDERFRRVYQRAAKEAWGVHVPLDVPRGTFKNQSYMQGEIVSYRLQGLIDAGAVKPPAPAPKVAKSREAATAELVAKRSAHAVKMLVASERRLRIAKAVHARWMKKVRYYERAAAKKKETT